MRPTAADRAGPMQGWPTQPAGFGTVLPNVLQDVDVFGARVAIYLAAGRNWANARRRVWKERPCSIIAGDAFVADDVPMNEVAAIDRLDALRSFRERR